jgi:hypothetical protein
MFFSHILFSNSQMSPTKATPVRKTLLLKKPKHLAHGGLNKEEKKKKKIKKQL